MPRALAVLKERAVSAVLAALPVLPALSVPLALLAATELLVPPAPVALALTRPSLRAPRATVAPRATLALLAHRAPRATLARRDLPDPWALLARAVSAVP